MNELKFNNLPKEKQDEILKRIAKSKEEKTKQRAVQKELGKEESKNRKELLYFAKQKNIQFAECPSLMQNGYSVVCGYIPPARPDNQKLSPCVMVVYSVACCSPSDKFDIEKAKLLIIERIRDGKVGLLEYRRNKVKQSEEKEIIPSMIDMNLVTMAITGIDQNGISLPQNIIEF